MKKSLCALSLVAAVSLMGMELDKYEASVGAGAFSTLGDHPLEDDIAYSLRFGRYLQENISVEFVYDFLTGVEYEEDREASVGSNQDFDTNINRFSLNGLYHFTDFEQAVPYLMAGFGYEDLTNVEFDADDDAFFNWGGGLKVPLDYNWALRAESKHAMKFNGKSSLLSTLGLAYRFGEKPMPKPEPAPEPAPIPEPKPMKKIEPPKDSDKDGVYDHMDQCPGTPEGYKVDAVGCPEMVDLKILFDYDKATIRQEFTDDLKRFAGFINNNPRYKVEIQGHTDSVGSESYNQDLSQRRADAVKYYLVQVLKVKADRVTAVGYGENRPITTNDTKENRALNRRIQAKLTRM